MATETRLGPKESQRNEEVREPRSVAIVAVVDVPAHAGSCVYETRLPTVYSRFRAFLTLSGTY